MNELKEALKELQEELEKCNEEEIEDQAEYLKKIGFDVKMCGLYLNGLVEDHYKEGTYSAEERLYEIIPEFCEFTEKLIDTTSRISLAIGRSHKMINRLCEAFEEAQE